MMHITYRRVWPIVAEEKGQPIQAQQREPIQRIKLRPDGSVQQCHKHKALQLDILRALSTNHRHTNKVARECHEGNEHGVSNQCYCGLGLAKRC